ncbi:MAG: hypothetical protein DRN15_10155 [Thermoprotei archaeon]|nr:MAG: hypothetical protein DRN15_10155 [Thermoprotei archaeon]RLF24847.1 MAG: hypothetical protein DRM97_02840 [Thermoprotei archaeon]
MTCASKLRAWLRIIRPINCFMSGLAVIVAVLIAQRGLPSMNIMYKVLLGFVTGFTITASSMIVNDYIDREIDAINDPTRPIPSGAISPGQALHAAILLGLIGVIASALTSLPCLIIAIAAWTLAVIYNAWGKRTGLPGNLMVSTCVSVPFIYGGALVERLDLFLLLFIAMAFLANTGREITKGIVDVAGDLTKGIKTLAIVKGESYAARIASIFYISAVALSPLPVLLGVVSLWYVPLVLITDIGLIKASLDIVEKPTRDVARRVKKRVLLWMLIGLIAFAAGTFS